MENNTVEPINQKANRRKSPVWKGIVKVVIIIYCLIGIGLYNFQDKLLFHPEAIPVTDKLNINQPHSEVTVKMDDKTSFHFIQFTVPDSLKKGVVLYFHGNSGNIENYANYAPYFTKHGYEIWMADYPGFGKSTGELNEQSLYNEAMQLYKLARSKYATDSIILYGKSLGTGIAAQLASIRDCRHLLLETPYYSIPSMASSKFWMYPLKQMLHYNLPTHEFLAKVAAPVTIFHGTDDNVIPYKNAKKLLPLLKKNDEFITIENGGHNNLYNYPMVTEKIDAILSK